jgi:hypothetical protein
MRAVMAVLHITYKHDPQTSTANFYGFYQVITSYRWTRLSNWNWAISADEPPQAVWQKLKRYIDPDEYLVMLPLEEPSSWSSQDHAAVKWLLLRP